MKKIQKKNEKSILRFYIASRRTDESQIQRTLPLAAVQKRQFNGTRTTWESQIIKSSAQSSLIFVKSIAL